MRITSMCKKINIQSPQGRTLSEPILVKVLFSILICFVINIKDPRFTETTRTEAEVPLMGDTFHRCLPSYTNPSLSSNSATVLVKNSLRWVLKGIKDEQYPDLSASNLKFSGNLKMALGIRWPYK